MCDDGQVVGLLTQIRDLLVDQRDHKDQPDDADQMSSREVRGN